MLKLWMYLPLPPNNLLIPQKEKQFLFSFFPQDFSHFQNPFILPPSPIYTQRKNHKMLELNGEAGESAKPVLFKLILNQRI